MPKVITRFPPSPTGYFHIGNARTALFDYLFAKHNGGEMILRFEDTDRKRSKPEYEEDILKGLEWLGIKYDNSKIEKQTEKGEVYKEYLKKLIDSQDAYVSKEETGERSEVIRFKNPNKKVKFTDLIRGEVEFDTTELGDFVIAKSVDEPIYHLAVVVDDHEMGITHVIRGDDGISNTPRQILIQEALGFERPIYAHLPLILGPDKSKLSSRHGAVSVNEYKEMGYLPEALVNYLALLGWNPGDDREIFSMEELTKEFSLEKVQKGGAIFNTEKLDWINKEHLKKLSDEEFLKMSGHDIPGELISLVRERVSRFGEVPEVLETEFAFYFNEPEVQAEKIVWKNDGAERARELLLEVKKLLEVVSDFTHDNVKNAVQPLADKEGKGSVLHPMRIALSGQDSSPDPFTIANLLGKEKTIRRLNKALENL